MAKISKCGRLSRPTLWSTFGRTIKQLDYTFLLLFLAFVCLRWQKSRFAVQLLGEQREEELRRGLRERLLEVFEKHRRNVLRRSVIGRRAAGEQTSTRVNFTTRALLTFYFRFANFHLRLQCLQSVDELLEFMEIWDFEISFAICHTGNRSKYIHVKGRVVQGPDPSGPGYADSPPVLRHWQLVLKYFQY